MKRQSKKIRPEWSYLVPAENVELAPSRLEISAGKEQMAAVARRLGIIAVEDLRADLQVSRDYNDHIIHVYGTLFADITKECVITLEPVKLHIEESFEGWF